MLSNLTGSSWPEAANIASEIARSKEEPLLGNHAGESETVIFLFGQLRLLFRIAARIRSRDSFNVASGSPRSE